MNLTPTLAHIGLGSNLGDREAHMRRALEFIKASEGCRLRQVSRFYETAAVGGPSNQGCYLNAAAEIETTLPIMKFLDLIQKIENQEGRVRTDHWGERTLDLDILLFGGRVGETDRLIVPHPRLLIRAFVLVPLSEIASNSIDPRSGKRIDQALAHCVGSPGVVDLVGWTSFAPQAFAGVETSLEQADWIVQDSTRSNVLNVDLPTIRILWKQAIEASRSLMSYTKHWPPSFSIDCNEGSIAVSDALSACFGTRNAGIVPYLPADSSLRS